jgi:putative transcriptional regulator
MNLHNMEGIIMNTRTNRKYRSELLAESHKTIEALHRNGMVSKTTLREFDEACLAPVKSMSPEEIRELREKAGVSQPVFAWYLNVSKNLISDWERGVKNPGGPALKLLNLVNKKGLDVLAP